MKSLENRWLNVEDLKLEVSDVEVVEGFINRDGRSIQLPEEVYYVLAAIVSAARGRR